MEYPGSIFTKKWRLIFLVFFVVIFLIASPLILLYATGYRYDWQNGLLKKTGSISIDIEPANTAIFLDGIKIKDKMPMRLKNITTRKYNLELKAVGYYDWRKDVDVKDKETFYIKEISLLKQTPPIKISSDTPLALALSPDGQYLAFANLKINQDKTVTNDYEIYIYNHSTGQIQFLAHQTLADTPKIDWSPDGNWLSITPTKKPINTINLISRQTGEIWTVTSSPKNPIAKTVWQYNLEPEIFFSTGKELSVARPIGKKIITIAKNDFTDWYPESGQIWTIKLNTTTQKYQITKDALGFPSIFAELSPDKITISTDISPKILMAKHNQILLQIKSGEMAMIDGSQNQYQINADEWRLSPYSDWWLFWNSLELTTFSAGTAPSLLTRSGENLVTVWPLDNHNTLGLKWTQHFDALFPYYSVNHTLLNQSLGPTAVDSTNHVIYFTATIKNENGLWKLEY